MDEDVTPYDCGEGGEFEADGAYRVHFECLTPKEKKAFEEVNHA